MCKGAQLTGWEKRLLLDMQSRKPTVRLRPGADAQAASGGLAHQPTSSSHFSRLGQCQGVFHFDT